MLGLILCGGQSQRMGTDKGLLKQDEKNWAKAAADKMASLNIPVKLSVNEKQLAMYAAIFSKDDLIVDNTSLSLKGPLLGTLSCHLAFPAEDIFVLACDMPLMDVSILHSLYTIYQQQPSADAYVFTNENEPEPLCGIYKAKALAAVLKMQNESKLVKHSMKFILDHLEVKKISIKEEEKKYFSNINTHSELNNL